MNEETIDDIVAEIRAYGAQPPPRLMWLEIADRIEAAWEREAAEIEVNAAPLPAVLLTTKAKIVNGGNAAAMRETLEYVLQFDTSDDAAMTDGLTDAERIMELASHIDECQKRARAALSVPPRQCDVGTAEEQNRRFNMFCKRKGEGFGESAYCAYECPCGNQGDCKLAWAQTPYEEGGAE